MSDTQTERNRTTIEVRGYKPNTSRHDITSLFESAHLPRGGEIENVVFDGTSKVAYATFKYREDAERAQTLSNFVLDGTSVTVSPARKLSQTLAPVDVVNDPRGCTFPVDTVGQTVDGARQKVSDARTLGGGETVDIHVTDHTTSRDSTPSCSDEHAGWCPLTSVQHHPMSKVTGVTFETHDEQTGLAGEHYSTIQPNQSWSSTSVRSSTDRQTRPTEERTPDSGLQKWDQLTIEVRGFKLQTSKKAFISCFQDAFLCPCGGEVEEVDTTNRSSGIVYVKFTKSGVAACVLSLSSVRVDGTVVDTMPCYSKTPDAETPRVDSTRTTATKGQDPDETRPTKQRAKKPAEESDHKTRDRKWDQHTIEVRNFIPDTPREELIRSFQNKELCPGGGEVEEVDTRHRSSGIVYVKFRKSGVAACVLSLTSVKVINVSVDMEPCFSESPRWAASQVTTAPLNSGVMNEGIGQTKTRPKQTSPNVAKKTLPGGAPMEDTTGIVKITVPLELYELRMLHANGFKSTQENRFPGMTVAIHTREREVRFQGETSAITAAQVAMNDIVKNMTDSYFDMSVHLISLVKGITMIRHMVDVFAREDISAVYAAVGHTSLGVFAQSEEHLKRAVNVIKRETNEICVEADSMLRPLLQTPQWVALKDQLKSQHEGLLTITDTADRVTVSGEVHSVALVYDKLQRLLVEHTGGSSDDSTGRSYVLGGCTVTVVGGNLTRFPVDAIVNAANEQLDHGAGLAKAIVDAGGPEIQRECRDHVKKHGRLKSGQVYVSAPGRLPCKKVIHAVGPKWQDGNDNEEKTLHDAVYESMLAAGKHNLSSIAFPALGGGIFGYPLDKCTKTIITAVRDFLEADTQSCVKNVSLVDTADSVVEEFHRSLDIVFGVRRVEMSHYGDSDSRSAAHTRHDTYRLPTANTSGSSVDGTDKSYVLGGSIVEVVQGDLTTFRAGAIVNAANERLDHIGGLARAISKAGGPEIQQECHAYVQQHGHLKTGQVYVSTPGRLPCKKVIHTVGPRWHGGNNNEEKELREAVYESLLAAESHRLSSIALPALSGGIFGYPLDKCTTTIVSAVKGFLEDHKQTCVKKVSLVDPADRIVDAFDQCVRKVSGI